MVLVTRGPCVKYFATATIVVMSTVRVVVTSRCESIWALIKSKKLIAYPISRPQVTIGTAVSCKYVCTR
jgi:hypothetical protein